MNLVDTPFHLIDLKSNPNNHLVTALSLTRCVVGLEYIARGCGLSSIEIDECKEKKNICEKLTSLKNDAFTIGYILFLLKKDENSFDVFELFLNLSGIDVNTFLIDTKRHNQYEEMYEKYDTIFINS